MRIETDSSVWIIDEDSMIYTRIPKGENISHPYLDYQTVGRPDTYSSIEEIEEYGHRKFAIKTASGRRIVTGRVLLVEA